MKIFVYGTLRAGFGNYRVLESVKALFIATAKTVDKFALYAKGIPYVSPKEKVANIVGEIYEVSEQALERLDQFEGHPNWYKRQTIEAIAEDGTVYSADLYFNDHPKGKLIPSGDFKDYKVTKQ